MTNYDQWSLLHYLVSDIDECCLHYDIISAGLFGLIGNIFSRYLPICY